MCCVHGGDDGVRRLWPLPAMLCGVLAGSALQLWQPELWAMWVYGSVLGAMGVVGACVLCRPLLRRRWLGQNGAGQPWWRRVEVARWSGGGR